MPSVSFPFFSLQTFILLVTCRSNNQQDAVFLLPACCDPFNEKALRAAHGVSLQLPIISTNWRDLHALVEKYDMKMLAGHPASSNDGSERTYALPKKLGDSLMSWSVCLVLGSEGTASPKRLSKLVSLQAFLWKVFLNL